LAVFAQAFDMKFDGFVNQLQDLFFGFGGSDTARQVRHVGAETRFTSFDNYRESHLARFYVAPSGLRIHFPVWYPGWRAARLPRAIALSAFSALLRLRPP